MFLSMESSAAETSPSAHARSHSIEYIVSRTAACGSHEANSAAYA